MDTLEIFGDEFTGVTGIKATNDNDETVIFYHAEDGDNLGYGISVVGSAIVGSSVIS